jgi:aspartyl-tRNA(Asn)/glutamyl-tRNA(Gln) amidotransferase subunit A
MTDDLLSLSLSEVANMVKERIVSPVELTKLCLARIDRLNPTLNAFISTYHEEAIDQAKVAEAEIFKGNYKGKLHGVPIAIKDNLYVANRVTTMGARIHKDFIPTHDAGVVTRLRPTGAILLGKTNMHEYALGATTDNPHFGTCRNPWDLSKIPGGSSGGSAAAVAAGLAFGALGTDTSGSIRVPAAACGLIGLKPTYGRVSKYGCFPEAWTLDHIGPLTRTVADGAIILDAISGFDPNDPTCLNLPPTQTFQAINKDIKDLVIGVEEDFFFGFVDHQVESLVRAGIEKLCSLGATVKSVKLPSLENAFWALTIIDTSETTAVHQPMMKTRAADYGDDVRFLIECGYLPSAVDYLQALQLRRHIKIEVSEMFKTVDVLIAPTLPSKTPSIGEFTSVVNGTSVDTIEILMHNVGPGNLLGLPSLSIPCGIAEGMPVGMEIIGPALGEQAVLNIALAFESTNSLNGASPTMSNGHAPSSGDSNQNGLV